MSGNGGMSPGEVISYIKSIEEVKPNVPAKAVMSGTRLGEKSGAGNLKESPFKKGK